MRVLERSSYTLLFVWLILLLCHSWFGPDIFYHLSWGRDLITRGDLWPAQRTLLQQPVNANVYLLFQALTYLLFGFGGLSAVSGLFILLWLAIAALWVRIIRVTPLTPWLLLIFIACAQLRFEARPEIFSYVFVLLLVVLLSSLKAETIGWRTVLVATFVLEVIWTSTHSYFPLGVLIAGAWLVAEVCTRSWRNVRAGALLLASTTAATFVSPAGAGTWTSVWSNLQVGAGLRDLNAELFAPSLWPPSFPLSLFWLMWIAVVLLAARALWRRDLNFAFWLALGGLVLSASSVRNLPLLFLLGAPALAERPAWNFSGTARTMERWALITLTLGLTLATARGSYWRWVNSVGHLGIQLEPSAYPLQAVEFLRAQNFKGLIYTDSYDGGYVEYELPEAHVTGDSYFNDLELTRTFFATIKVPAAFLALLDRATFDALLINTENLDVLQAALTRTDFRLVYADAHRALFWREALPGPPRITLAQGSYYDGSKLDTWADMFGPLSWLSLARTREDRGLVHKLCTDLARAPELPATVVMAALALALESKDRDLVTAAAALRARVRQNAQEDPRWSELARATEACCK